MLMFVAEKWIASSHEAPDARTQRVDRLTRARIQVKDDNFVTTRTRHIIPRNKQSIDIGRHKQWGLLPARVSEVPEYIYKWSKIEAMISDKFPRHT